MKPPGPTSSGGLQNEWLIGLQSQLFFLYSGFLFAAGEGVNLRHLFYLSPRINGHVCLANYDVMIRPVSAAFARPPQTESRSNESPLVQTHLFHGRKNTEATSEREGGEKMLFFPFAHKINSILHHTPKASGD